MSYDLFEEVKAGNVDNVKLLVAFCTDINDTNLVPTTFIEGVTLLHCAASYGYTDIVCILIATGADINAKDKNGWTPLHYSTNNGPIDTVQVLLDGGADVNAKNNDGETPLLRAAGTGRNDIVELLLIVGAAINVQDNNGLTPQKRASLFGHSCTARLLRAKQSSKMVKTTVNLDSRNAPHSINTSNVFTIGDR